MLKRLGLVLSRVKDGWASPVDGLWPVSAAGTPEYWLKIYDRWFS